MHACLLIGMGKIEEGSFKVHYWDFHGPPGMVHLQLGPGDIQEFSVEKAHANDEVTGRGLTRELLEVINDPDVIHLEPTARLIELSDALTRNNLIIYKWIETIGVVRIPRDLELGVREYYAWQLPIYRIIMRQLLT